MSAVGDDHLADTLSRCESILQYEFREPAMLEHALTHASVAKTRLASNERLEFLGDAILGALVCEYLFEQFPDAPEGELTRIKSSVVSRNTCAEIAYRLGLDELLLVGKGLSSHDAIPDSLVAAVFESVIAALYLDGGMDVARSFICRVIETEVEKVADSAHGRNYKSLLQQVSQRTEAETPVYQLLDEKGPDHSKCFKMAAIVGNRTFSAAWGSNKKEAEQRAAHNALCEIEGDDVPHVAD